MASPACGPADAGGDVALLGHSALGHSGKRKKKKRNLVKDNKKYAFIDKLQLSRLRTGLPRSFSPEGNITVRRQRL